LVSFELPFDFSLKSLAQYHVRVGLMSLNLLAVSLQTAHRFLQILDLNRGRDLYMTWPSFLQNNDVGRWWVLPKPLRPRVAVTSYEVVSGLALIEPPQEVGVGGFRKLDRHSVPQMPGMVPEVRTANEENTVLGVNETTISRCIPILQNSS
jgi:hypothetical protein